MFHVILHYSLLYFIILDKWKKIKFIKFHIFTGKAVGIRNFPDKGKDAEEFLRTAFEIQIKELGGCCLPDQAVCVDMGCGTGK